MNEKKTDMAEFVMNEVRLDKKEVMEETLTPALGGFCGIGCGGAVCGLWC